MLFKYLLAPVALAASVVCYPPGYSGQSPSIRPSPDYVNTNVDFNTCTRKFEQAREPLASSCRAHSVQEATSKLSGLYEPVHTLSNKLHVAIRSDTKVAFKYSSSLVSLFSGFQGIVDTIGRYPKVVQSSQETIFEFNAQFEHILNDFSSAGVDTHEVFSQSTNIRFESWQKLGFSFPEKLGLYGEN
ncbi:hypothetical protein MJO28_005020 [Puccinia striiformis f. sp. tritici]|uniref:Uncharacterized protein n=2 Tax=Puccinia striiformis f. sp. tritici TaxID=168172 RepID=A0A0L0USD1_9BASI|nr:hypothetical protein Pst134EB_010253 [Puccinia striiformis f. sp. tritici]KAI7954620.1 hypothetical protein MJO28_005020 [Puccinia striiformis f. sp. tritici]KAI9622559.1 hypothetical protein KEM48_007176 [Puccinia striiformis f. sp. tritici PST-130]KNE89836.1 hypothetical protein PSTG_16697 [Puccinia striiformis f. sp. tritici PST-78]